jgi:heterodisulfide reductase subunit C
MTIVDALTGAALAAALFIIFGLLRPARECSGDCGSCTGACPSGRPTEGGKS